MTIVAQFCVHPVFVRNTIISNYIAYEHGINTEDVFQTLLLQALAKNLWLAKFQNCRVFSVVYCPALEQYIFSDLMLLTVFL